MTAPGRGFIEVAGRRVFIEEWGSGPALLCLHGLGGGTHFFSEVGPLLAARHRTIAFDFPGAGQSPSTLPISFEVFAEIVVALAASLNVSDPALLGHSMGTIIGLEAIRVSPRLTSRFIAVGGVTRAARLGAGADIGPNRRDPLERDRRAWQGCGSGQCLGADECGATGRYGAAG